MSTLHFGYEPHTEEALRTILGNDFWARELTISTNRPYVDAVGEYGTVESRPIERLAIVIEGERDKIQPLAEAIQQLQKDAP